MDRQQIGLKLAVDALGVGLRLDTFANRLQLQKAIYLAQEASVQLGYSFHWYLRGPYSRALTRDAFAVAAELKQGNDESAGWQLDRTSMGRLEHLKSLFASVPTSDLPAKLELLASVHFLLKSRSGQERDAGRLREVLAQNNKIYPETQIREAVEELSRYGLNPGSNTI